MSVFTNGFIGFIGIGTGIPALALIAGYPEVVTQGLGSPFANWMPSKEAKLGLYLYTVSDIVLGAFCAISLKSPETVTPTAALTATAIHQFSYLSTAIAAFGFRKDHIPIVIMGTVSAGLALNSLTVKST